MTGGRNEGVAVASSLKAPPMNHEACQGTARIVARPELAERLAAMPAWSLQHGKLFRQLNFDSFAAAFAFVTALALLAERCNHHPGFSIDKRDVEITVWTRKMSAVTTLDVELAAEIDL